jgi:hypothetical protein
VFTTHLGAALDPGNVRKMFKRVCTAAGAGDAWTPRELRTSFVSLLSHRGVSIEEIARLVGHASTRTTEVVYRRELRPVITTGAPRSWTNSSEEPSLSRRPGSRRGPAQASPDLWISDRNPPSQPSSHRPSADLARHHAL